MTVQRNYTRNVKRTITNTGGRRQIGNATGGGTANRAINAERVAEHLMAVRRRISTTNLEPLRQAISQHQASRKAVRTAARNTMRSAVRSARRT